MTLKYKNMQKTSEQGAGINDVTRISKGATINGDLIFLRYKGGRCHKWKSIV